MNRQTVIPTASRYLALSPEARAVVKSAAAAAPPLSPAQAAVVGALLGGTR